MKQMGRKHRHYYRIVAIDGRQPRDGRVLDPEAAKDAQSTRAIVEMSRRLRDDQRVDWCMLPVGDGVAMGRKR